MKRFFSIIVLVVSFLAGVVAETAVKLTWPDDFSDARKYDGKLVELNQKLYVTNIGSWNKYGEITLSSKRLMSPTEVALPGLAEYRTIVDENEIDQLVLSDGSDTQYPNPRPWIGDGDYIRTGAYTMRVVGRFSIEEYGYTITPTEMPVFEGNERPVVAEDLGDYSVKVCGFNLCYYMAAEWGDRGPADAAEAEKQHKKIVRALAAIDADVFGLVEVQQGQLAMEKLANALNAIDSEAEYTYINDGTQVNGTYTKSGYLYKASKLKPLRQLQSNDTGVKNRKKAQGFEVKATSEKFVFMINHFKAKSGSGSGDNADAGDGQGTYNGDRVREATAVVTFAKSCATYFGDNDVLVMGDLNAYSMEDPIRVFTNGGYTNLIKKYEGEGGYSYSYRGAVGCLDHALANESMTGQVTGCEVFHVNTDESTVFAYDGYSYQDNMYRSSDHDPVVVGLRLGVGTSIDPAELDNGRIVYGANGVIGIVAAAGCEMKIYTLMGQEVYSETIVANDYTLSTSEVGLTSGIYIVRLSEGTAVKLVVK